MIDWITARVPIRSAADLNTGVVMSISAEGEEEWSSDKRVHVGGSHASTVAVKRFKSGEIEFAGSPAKFLQGHNLFGSDDLQGLGAAMIERACCSLGLDLLGEEVATIRAGDYELKRVDVNYSFETGSRANAIAWIGKAAAVGTLQGRGRGKRYRSSTVMWGDKSRYWTLKVYSKGDEISAPKHGLPPALPMRTELAEWGDDKLRIELQLQARQLKKLGLDRASRWRETTPYSTFERYRSKLRLGGHLMLSPNVVQSLPYRLRQTYSNWVRGEDLRQLMSNATYYRHCKELLAFGVNIGAAPQRDVTTIPLSKYLETPCVEIPGWAVGTKLYVNPVERVEPSVHGRESIKVRRESGVTRIERGHDPATSQPPVESRSEESVHARGQLGDHKRVSTDPPRGVELQQIQSC